MSQTILFVAIHLLGLAVCLAIGPRRVPALSCALAFPLGLAVAVLLLMAMLLIGVPSSPWTLGPAMVTTAAAALLWAVRRGADRQDFMTACWWTVVFATACVALTHFNVAIFSNDSHSLLILALAIANQGSLTPDILARLDKQGVFEILAHSMVGFSRRDFLYALPLTLGLAFIPMFGLALWHGLHAIDAPVCRRSALVVLATAALFTISTVGYHILYVHTNLGAAVYLFGYVVLFWIAEVRREPEWLPPAFISLVAFALHRTETPLVALLFLVLTLTQTKLPRRAITGWLAVFTGVVVVWYENLARHVAGSGFITPARARLMWTLLVVFFIWWLASRTRVVHRINRLVPTALAGSCALALVAAFATKPDHMFRSSINWVSNLMDLPFWGGSWFFIFALILLGLAADAPRFRLAFALGLPLYFAFVLLLAYFRVPYRIGAGDSANRMTIHVVPLIFYYLSIKFIPLLLTPAASAVKSESAV